MAFGRVNVPGASILERGEAEAALLARVASVEKTLDGAEKIPGSSDPTAQTAASPGQIYINTATGEEWKCVSAGEEGTVWEKREGSAEGLTDTAPFAAGTSAPSDKKKLWIDTTANTGGLKYWNGSAWVFVPVAYT